MTGKNNDERAPVPRGRGRPRAYDRDRAVRQARDLFWKTGLSGTSLDEIAAATGMNRPSLRAAFGDKHGLYLDALRDYWTLKFATMQEALGAPSLDDALMRVYSAALSLYFTDDGWVRGCFVVGTAVTEAAEHPEIRAIVDDGFHRLDAAFEARLRLARARHELDEDADIEALAALATATMHSLAVRARAGARRADLEKLARQAVTLICGRGASGGPRG